MLNFLYLNTEKAEKNPSLFLKSKNFMRKWHSYITYTQTLLTCIKMSNNLKQK